MAITITTHAEDNGFFSLTDSADTAGSGQIFPRIYQCNIRVNINDVLNPYRISFHNIFESQVKLEPSYSAVDSFNLTDIVAGSDAFSFNFVAVPNVTWLNRQNAKPIDQSFYRGIGREPSVFYGGNAAKLDSLKTFDRFRIGANDEDIFGVKRVEPAAQTDDDYTGFRVYIDRPLTAAQITKIGTNRAVNHWVAPTGIVAHFNKLQIITWKKPR